MRLKAKIYAAISSKLKTNFSSLKMKTNAAKRNKQQALPKRRSTFLS
jgi:hypothetical protein